MCKFCCLLQKLPPFNGSKLSFTVCFFLGQCLRNVFEYISLIDHQPNIFNVHFLVSNILKPESLLVKKFKVIVLLDAFFKIISSFKSSVVSTISLVNFIYQRTQTNPKTWMAVITGLTLYQGI